MLCLVKVLRIFTRLSSYRIFFLEERLDYESERASLMSTRSDRMSIHSGRSNKSNNRFQWPYRSHRSRYQPIGDSDE